MLNQNIDWQDIEPNVPVLRPEALAELKAGKGTKDDQGKPDLALWPPEAYLAIGEIFTHGAKKYTADNWRNGMSWRRMLSALERHIQAWKSGEDNDDGPGGSGQNHLAHAGCCLTMLLTYAISPEYKKFDDRWSKDKIGKVQI